MNDLSFKNKVILISTIEFEHLLFEQKNDEYVVTLVDKKGYKILKGYGTSTAKAINDLHHNLIQ